MLPLEYGHGNNEMLRHAMIWAIVPVMTLAGYTSAADWMGFRGPGTRGISDETGLAVTWSETENLKWKILLPGPGSSSPIVMDEKVFVTCYSGYGLDPDTGKSLWFARTNINEIMLSAEKFRRRSHARKCYKENPG